MVLFYQQTPFDETVIVGHLFLQYLMWSHFMLCSVSTMLSAIKLCLQMNSKSLKSFIVLAVGIVLLRR